VLQDLEKDGFRIVIFRLLIVLYCERNNLHSSNLVLVLFSNQGGIKSALTGKAASNAKGKISHMLKEVKNNV
jgi:histidinol phosphatase-like enzyme